MASANLVSDSFWCSRGFIPARHKLTRRIDPRVSWVNTDLSYGHFRTRLVLGRLRNDRW